MRTGQFVAFERERIYFINGDRYLSNIKNKLCEYIRLYASSSKISSLEHKPSV